MGLFGILVIVLLLFAFAGAPPANIMALGWIPSGALILLAIVLVAIALVRRGGPPPP